jgi:hypothetical protein
MGSPAVLDDDDLFDLVSALERFGKRFPEAQPRQSVFALALGVAACPVACTAADFGFALQLAAWLNDQPVKADEVDRHPLKRLLTFFLKRPDSYGFLAEDVDLFDRLLKRLEARARENKLADKVKRGKEPNKRIGAALVLSRTYAIDRDILHTFDLEPQVRTFAALLRPPNAPSGIVTVAVGAAREFFDGYVRPRLLHYLEGNIGLVGVSYKWAWIENSDADDPRYAAVADDIAAMPGDVFFLLMHEHCPADTMKQAALALAGKVASRLEAVLRQRRRLVVLVWLRNNDKPLELDARLPAPEPLDAELVANWLAFHLKDTVGEDDLEACKAYLLQMIAPAGGAAGATYQALDDVFNALQGRPI